MEILTIVLSSLLSVLSGGGIVVDTLVKSQIGARVIGIEEQAIRIDNRPSYRLAQGRIQQVKIATRGVEIEPGLRIAALEVVTDPLAFKQTKLNLDSIETFRSALAKPASGMVRLVITQADINRVLKSPQVLAQFQEALNRALSGRAGSAIGYQLSDLNVELRPANRLEIRFKLSRAPFDRAGGTSTIAKRSKELDVVLKLAVEVEAGKILRAIAPEGTINGRPMSSRLLNGFATGISERLNLDAFSADGILVRILQLEINEDKLESIGFIFVETKSVRLSLTKIVFPRIRSIIHAGSQ